MSLFKTLDVAGSALAAQTVRLNTTASNMANANTISSSLDQTYKARHPVFAALYENEINADPSSVAVTTLGIVESKAPVFSEYRPDHPEANGEGYIFRPNVNVVEEMADMISASRSYQSNVEVMNSSKQMLLRTLSLGQ